MIQTSYREEFLKLVGECVPEHKTEITRILIADEWTEKFCKFAVPKLEGLPEEIRRSRLITLLPSLKMRMNPNDENFANYTQAAQESLKTDLAYKSRKMDEAKTKVMPLINNMSSNPTQARLQQKLLEKQKTKFLVKEEQKRRESLSKFAAQDMGIQKIINHPFYARSSSNENKENVPQNDNIDPSLLVTKKKRRGRTKKSKSHFAPKTVPAVIEKKAEAVGITPTGESVDLTKVRETFFANLLHSSSEWRYHTRVSRWQETDLAKIKGFKDFKPGVGVVERYQKLSPQALRLQRAKHCLPGTERMLSLPYRTFYACETPTGYVMVARFTFGKITEDGLVSIGCEDNRVHHCYFEKKNFNEDANQFLREDATETGRDGDSNEVTIRNCEVEITEQDGVITFAYPDNYSISIFPLRKDLLEKEIGPL